jgi:hypothetical protein
MAMNRLTLSFLLALVVAPTAAFAQGSRPERPYRGLFGGGVGSVGQLLTFGADLGGGYDDNVLSSTNTKRTTSAFEMAVLNLAYNVTGRRVNFNASLMSGATFYEALQSGRVVSTSANLGGSFVLSRKTSLSLSESLSFQPLYALASFPTTASPLYGLPATFDTGLATRASNHINSATTATLNQAISSRIGLSLNYSRAVSGQVFFAGRDVATDTAAAHLNVGLAKGLSLRAGYGESIAQYGGGAPSFRSHAIDAGLDLSRALTLSRRLTLSFSSGSTVVTYANKSNFSLVGDARLTREIGRSWAASFGYSRAVAASGTFRQPVTADAVTTSIGGLVNRRVQLQFGGGAQLGHVGFGASAQTFHVAYASTGITVALSRMTALAITYGSYWYTFAAGLALPPGVQPRSDRQTIRANLSLWVPLVARRRSTDVAR